MRSRGQIYFDLQIQFVLNLNFWFGFWMIRGEFDILYSQGMIKNSLSKGRQMNYDIS